MVSDSNEKNGSPVEDIFQNPDFKNVISRLIGIVPDMDEKDRDPRLLIAEALSCTTESSSEIHSFVDGLLDKLPAFCTRSDSGDFNVDVFFSEYQSVQQSIDEADTDYFRKTFAVKLLDRMVRLLSGIPTPEEFQNADNQENLLNQMTETQNIFQAYYHALFNLPMDDSVARLLENLRHDMGNLYADMPYAYSLMTRHPSLSSNVYADMRVMRDILDANHSIASSNFSLSEFSPVDSFGHSIGQMERRFRMNAMCKGDDDYVPFEELTTEGNILLDAENDARIVGNSASLNLLVYNLLKNSMKVVERTGKKVNACVRLSELSDELVSIVVMDTGMGLSYDELRDYFTDRALLKRRDGHSLTFCEELLLDDYWRSRVTPFLLEGQIFKRGESLGKGTGIGLDIVKQIVEAHQGDVRIYDHAEYGAGVEIVLPNTKNESPEYRKRLVRDYLRQSMTGRISNLANAA